METMEIIANGETYQVEAGISLTTFLEQNGQMPGKVVVERNGDALSPSDADGTLLEPGDRLEIVRSVAGG
jgi:thiamine biosynthesis protein ThiS